MSYQCYNCYYKTDIKCNFINHINRKKKCKRNPDSLLLDEEIKNKHENQLKSNIKKIETEIEEKDPLTNRHLCPHCEKTFDYKFNLNKHIREKHMINDNVININANNLSVDNSININTNNITISLNDDLIPFNKDWDLSKISDEKKYLLLFSKFMYTNLLKEILENDANLNVIINKETNSGLVYSEENMEKKYINMDLSTILEQSMEKLYRHLRTIYREAEQTKLYNTDKDMIFEMRNKYMEYQKNEDLNEKVNDLMSDLYNRKRRNAVKLMDIHNPFKDLKDIKGF